jgi:hypothetical protein
MAYEVCKEITGNDNLKTSIKADRKEAMDDARLIGSYEDDPVEEIEDDWITAMN